MFKKILLLSILSIILISCWNDDLNSSWLTTINNWNFSMQIPSNWEVIEDKEDILPKASVWNIELAVTSKNVINWFANNLLILSDKINKITTSSDYSMLNNVWAKSDYLWYREIKSDAITFIDDEQWMLYVFEARYNLDTPTLKFLQTAHICNQTDWYFITIAIPTSISDTSKYEELLKSFKCK